MEADQQRHCAHCGLEVEDRGHPLITETGVFHSIWVHTPGGYMSCYPQQGGRSPRATPLSVAPTTLHHDDRGGAR